MSKCSVAFAALASITGLGLPSLESAAQAAKLVKHFNRDAFVMAAGAVQTETFDSYVSDVTATPTLDFGIFKMTDSRQSGAPGPLQIDAAAFQSPSINGSTFARASVSNGRSGIPEAWVEIEFAAATTGFGADWLSTNNGIVRLEIDGVAVEETVGGNAFFGFTSDTAFKRVRLVGPSFGNSTTYRLDNITVAEATSVPEPAAWALMIAGFGLVGGSLRRRATTGLMLTGRA